MITCNRVSTIYNFGLPFVIDFAVYPTCWFAHVFTSPIGWDPIIFDLPQISSPYVTHHGKMTS
jgi:hypothetical protein